MYTYMHVHCTCVSTHTISGSSLQGKPTSLIPKGEQMRKRGEKGVKGVKQRGGKREGRGRERGKRREWSEGCEAERGKERGKRKREG